ncbi:ribosomal RNA small subunit methyltransferase A [Candidatus Saccharibacteria bacterium]|nr:ribosomal RNA small subunit methyltransferase A [Candidatus Saccharibacteria bacterium]
MDLPRKSLGQHWLKDEPTLAAICRAAQLGESDVVLEIGPGLGALTKHLVKKSRKVVAVELDKTLADQLPKSIPSRNLEVVNGDILKFDFSKLPSRFKVVANIPYYLTSNLLRVLSESKNPPKVIVMLVQKEVAERIAARPGKMSVLAVSVQLYYEAELGQVVPAIFFEPPPKVDSQVIILRRHFSPLFDNVDEKKFFRLVKAGFSSRRKMLRSSLAGGLDMSKHDIEEMLMAAEVNGDLRAEALSLTQWHSIYTEYVLKKDLRSLLHLNT